MKYLHVHRNRYYFKRKIPHSHLNIVASLQTDSLSTAKSLLVIINAKTFDLFQRLKKGELMDVNKIKAMVNRYIEEGLKEYSIAEEFRHKALTIEEDGKTYGGHTSKAINKALDHIREVLMIGDEKQLREEAEKILKRSNISRPNYLALSEKEKHVLHYELLKGETNILLYDDLRNQKRLTEALETEIVPSFEAFSTPKQNNIPAPTVPITPQYSPRELSKTISEVSKDFLAAKGNIKEGFRYTRDIEFFASLIGKEYLCEATHEDYDRYLQDIRYLPVQNKYKKLFEEKSPAEVIEISKREELDRIKTQTLQNKIINVNAFLDFAENAGYVKTNMLKKKVKYAGFDPIKKVPRVEYRMEQLHNLFYKSDWYTTSLESNFHNSPSKIWIPLMLLFNGFRLNEAAQLYLDQIVKRDGVWMFRIAIDYKEQKLKNAESKRTIAIHPKLIEFGFLNFYNQQKQLGHTRLFEELYFTRGKGYGQDFSKDFNDINYKKQWLEEETIQKIKNEIILLDAHSFRHTFIGHLIGVIEDDARESFVGHKYTDSKYGKLKPKVALELISKCVFELDLNPLSEKLNELYRPYEN